MYIDMWVCMCVGVYIYICVLVFVMFALSILYYIIKYVHNLLYCF
jgi:hypothetical protein